MISRLHLGRAFVDAQRAHLAVEPLDDDARARPRRRAAAPRGRRRAARPRSRRASPSPPRASCACPARRCRAATPRARSAARPRRSRSPSSPSAACVSCRSASTPPNIGRRRARASASSSARRAKPSAAAATDARKMSSVRIASLKPSPARAEQRVAGSAAAVEREPRQRMRRDHVEALGDGESRRVGGHDERRDAASRRAPRRCARTRSRSRRCRRWRSTSSSPSSTQCVPSRRAVVASAATSEPASGSDSANAAIASPRATRGSQRARCAAVPASVIGAAAEALHREREVGQSVVVGQHLARDAQRARVERRATRRRTPPGRSAAGSPASPSARTQRAAGRVDVAAVAASTRLSRAAYASSVDARARDASSSKNGQCRSARDRTHQLPSNVGVSLRGERLVRAAEVLGLHADRLRLRLGLDLGVEIHRPRLVQQRLGHRVREGRTVGERRASACASASSASGATTRLKKPHAAPSSALIARPRVAAAPRHGPARSCAAAARTRPCRRRRVRRGRTGTRSSRAACRCGGRHASATIAPAPAQTPSTAATIGCGQWRIALTRSPVMRVNASSPGACHAASAAR